MIGEDLREHPAAMRVLQTAEAFGVRESDVTSVAHGGHTAGSAHYAGRAVDLGSIGGQPVGSNQTTWDFNTHLIEGRGVARIGTIGALANNPTLRSFAQQHGVILFEDEGSGPHVHLQVDAS